MSIARVRSRRPPQPSSESYNTVDRSDDDEDDDDDDPLTSSVASRRPPSAPWCDLHSFSVCTMLLLAVVLLSVIAISVLAGTGILPGTLRGATNNSSST